MSDFSVSEVYTGPVNDAVRLNLESRLVGQLAEIAHRKGLQFTDWPKITWRAMYHSGSESWHADADVETTTREEAS